MTETTRKPISRRTVAKGAAWTAPVILGGMAAPAYASSGPGPTITPGPSCKQPGNSCNPIVKGYVFTYTINNPSSKPIWLYVPPTLSTGGVLPLSYAGAVVNGVFYGPEKSIPIPAGSSVQLLVTTSSGNSSDLVFNFTITFAWGHTADPAGDTEHVDDPVSATVVVDGTPPCKDCAPPTGTPDGSTTAKSSTEEAATSTSESKTATSSTSTETSSSSDAAPADGAPAAAEPTDTSTTAP